MGGPAEFLAVADSAGELAELVRAAWELGIDPLILGGGSNVLVSDVGVQGLVILNRARAIVFHDTPGAGQTPSVWAESGVNLGALARQCGGARSGRPATGPPRCPARWAARCMAMPAPTAATRPAIWFWPKSCNKMAVCGAGT